MKTPPPPTVHATAVLAGALGVLIRGPAGAGKSRLAWDLIAQTGPATWPFARLVGDDRIVLEAVNGRLLARPAENLRGLIEMRGLGLLHMPYEPCATIGVVIDLAAEDGARLPEETSQRVELLSVRLPRLPVAPGMDARAIFMAWMQGSPSA